MIGHDKKIAEAIEQALIATGYGTLRDSLTRVMSDSDWAPVVEAAEKAVRAKMAAEAAAAPKPGSSPYFAGEMTRERN